MNDPERKPNLEDTLFNVIDDLEKKLEDSKKKISIVEGAYTVLFEELEVYEKFEDEVRDIMDFMPHDEHYDKLNSALGRMRLNPIKKTQK